MNYESEIFEYAIQPYDTLWDLADAYNTSVEEIMAANADLDPNNMYIGQVIQMPVDTEVDASQRRPGRPGRPPFRRFRRGFCPGGRPYTIQPGDTFYNLGFRFRISPRAIINANPFLDFRFPLQVGQVICLPFR